MGCRVQAEIQRDKHKAERELERNCPDQRCTVGEAKQRWESWAPSPTLRTFTSPLSQEPPILQEECVCSQRMRNFFLNILEHSRLPRASPSPKKGNSPTLMPFMPWSLQNISMQHSLGRSWMSWSHRCRKADGGKHSTITLPHPQPSSCTSSTLQDIQREGRKAE